MPGTNIPFMASSARTAKCSTISPRVPNLGAACTIFFTSSRMRLYSGEVRTSVIFLWMPRYLCSAPTLGEMDISLSFRMTMRSRSVSPALFSASYGSPHVMLPSPMTAMTSKSCPCRSRAAATPTAAEMLVPACPAPNTSYSLSSRRRNPLSPWRLRMLSIRSLRPVRILCGYAWCPTSQMSWSRGVSKARCRATVSSTVPRLEPKWAPLCRDTTSMMRSRTSVHSCSSCASERARTSSGVFTVSRSDTGSSSKVR